MNSIESKFVQRLLILIEEMRVEKSLDGLNFYEVFLLRCLELVLVSCRLCQIDELYGVMAAWRPRASDLLIGEVMKLERMEIIESENAQREGDAAAER